MRDFLPGALVALASFAMAEGPAQRDDGNAGVLLEDGLTDAGVAHWEFHPRLGTSLVWTDNVYLTRTRKLDDFLFTAAPGADFLLGDFEDKVESWLIADYTASLVQFAVADEENAVDHDAGVSGEWRFPKWMAGFSGRYSTVSSGALSGGDLSSTESERMHIEAGNRADREVYSFGGSARYELTGKSSLTLALRDSSATFDQRFPIHELATRNWLDWQALPKLGLGLGYAFRHVDLGELPSLDFQETGLRLRYWAGEKFAVEASSGRQIQTIEAASGRDCSPLFSLLARYDARQDAPGEVRGALPHTGWLVDACRQSNPSVSLAGQTYAATDFGATFVQRIAGGFSLALGVRGRITEYASPAALEPPRRDESFFTRPALIYEEPDRFRAELYYQFFENSSSTLEAGFDATVQGLRITAVF